jgi:multidrug efflux system membrane fusion protein
MPVGVAPPIAKRVTQWDEFSGRFEAVASVEVRARVSGFIEELHFKDGQLVNVGDLLFTIDKRPYDIAVESAKADVARNKAQVGLAELQVQRGASLITSRTITEQENDQRKANLEVAKAQLKAAEAAQRSAELNLDWTDVRAPIAGRISDRKVDAGNLIHRHPRSDSLRVRRLGVGLSALHAPLPVGRDGLVAGNQSRAHPAGR